MCRTIRDKDLPTVNRSDWTENGISECGPVAITALAVNALRTPAFAFPQVAAAFRRSHGHAVGLGFTEVWICGPVEDMVFRLDEP